MSEEKIIKINIEEQMKSAYIDYSMSVIVARALPDVRDGMKPVHRRILYGMNELGVLSNRPYKKSARIVGDVLGKYHPHGDSSVYFAMARMVQDWSLRYPLVDGQGNFGSIDGDSPAAMRYTEVRLKKAAEYTLSDLDKDTVDFQPNFDESLQEPSVLPTRIPTLLINGTSGIAVGMATNMPPHNLSDSIDTIIHYIDNRDSEIEDLIPIIKAPDFPTGGTIYGYKGIKDAYETGRGRIVIRGKSYIEIAENGREKIIITEIPYLVNKAELIIKIADLVNEKKIEGISNINDESDRKGMRIVIDLKKDTLSSIVLNQLYKLTQLQSSFSVNNIALVKGKPRLLNLKDIVHYFVEHRHDVVIRRTKYELAQAERKAHILKGLIVAIDNLDEVIKIIRSAKTPEEAREKLMSSYDLDDIQTKAILDMRLQKLTGLEREKLFTDYKELCDLIVDLKDILENQDRRMSIIKEELLEIKSKFGDNRKTEIVPDEGEFNPEDFYADEEMVITISHMGYIKRTSLSEFKTQGRGGVGAKGSSTRNEDFLEHMFVATMHNTLLLFTKNGKCFWLKVYDIPEGAKNTKGRAIQNVINIENDDKVMAYINVKTLKEEDYINQHNIVLCTKKGIVKKTLLEAYSRPRQKGVNAITIKEGDELLEATLTNGKQELIMAGKSGKAIRFHEGKVRAIGRTGAGVRGITLADENDYLVGMICVDNADDNVLVVSENGYGKRSPVIDYRITNRGGKGVKTLNITEKTGDLIAIKDVTDNDDLMIITNSGITIRVSVNDIRLTGRNAQGVKLINIKDGDKIASVARVSVEDSIEIDNESIKENEEIENENIIENNEVSTKDSGDDKGTDEQLNLEF